MKNVSSQCIEIKKRNYDKIQWSNNGENVS